MSKGPSANVVRVVLEGPRAGEKAEPAVYIRKWWWFFTTWWAPAWIRHSYIANREAKAKNKAMDLYQQLLKSYEDAKAAEKDVGKFIREAREGDTRGVSSPGVMKLGAPEDYLLFDKEAWTKMVPVFEALKNGSVDLSRRRHTGERSAYYLKGQLPGWKVEAKGKPTIMAGVDHNIEFRPPDENKGGNKGGKGNNQNQQGNDKGVQVVMVQPSNKED